MGQFLVGLFAGVVVGLVMEWVIDWTGLLPKRSMNKGKAQKAGQGGAVPSTPLMRRAEGPPISSASKSSSNAETSEE